MAKNKASVTEEPTVERGPELAEIRCERVFNPTTGMQDDVYTWDGPETGILVLPMATAGELLPRLPFTLEAVAENALAKVIYFRRLD